MKTKIIFTIFATMILVNCQSASKQADAPIQYSDDSDFSKLIGNATWYGKDKDGLPTSTGGLLDMLAIEATSTQVPVGSYVWVTNTENQKRVKVQINNKQSLPEGIILDVSYATAKKLGFHKKEFAQVEIEMQSQKGNDRTNQTTNQREIDNQYSNPYNNDEEITFENSLREEITDGNLLYPNSGEENIDSPSYRYKYPYGKPNGYTIQVGAFLSKKRAERYRLVIENRFNKKAYMAIINPYHKVWVGNFSSQEEARRFKRDLQSERIETMNPRVYRD